MGCRLREHSASGEHNGSSGAEGGVGVDDHPEVRHIVPVSDSAHQRGAMASRQQTSNIPGNAASLSRLSPRDRLERNSFKHKKKT